jgi:hypothetical protein
MRGQHGGGERRGRVGIAAQRGGSTRDAENLKTGGEVLMPELTIIWRTLSANHELSIYLAETTC